MVPFLDLRAINARHRDELVRAMVRVLDSGWYVLGRELADFEAAYAAFCGARHCIGVGNGLDALTLILRGYKELGILRPGDEVIAPANTYIASLLAITENSLIPVLVEPDERTYGIDESLVEQALSERTKAIMVVHLYGRIAHTRKLQELAARRSLIVVEDGAQSCGAALGGVRSGSLGDAAGHSFFPTKNLGGLGDAGAVTTSDAALAEVVRSLRNYGSRIKYVNDHQGLNSRLDELQAAVLTVKLAFLQEENLQRRRIAKYYIDNIHNPKLSLPEFVPDDSHVWHLFVVRTEHRDAFQRHLAQCGIETLIHYPIPPHRQAAYREWSAASYPLTERIHRTVISLPLDISAGPQTQAAVVEACNRY